MRFLRALARRPRTACTGALLAGAPVILMTLFPGCQAAYLGKQAFGALRMLCGRVAVDAELLEKLPPKERDRLEWAARVRRYAEEELGLTPGDAYTTYYDTGSAPISTIVVAAHPL